MPSQEKKDKVKQIKKWFDKTDELLVLNYKGLSVAEANELRVKLKGMDSELRVLKNTLTRIAVADTPKEGVTPLLDGPVAVVFIENDSANVAKAIRDFGKGRQEFYLRGGMLEGRVLSGKQVEAFALLPPREVLLAQMAGMLQAPMARLIGTVVAPARKMLGLFQALADKRAAEAPVPAEAPAAAAPETKAAGQSVPAEDPAEKPGTAEAPEAPVEEAPAEALETAEAPEAPVEEAPAEALETAEAPEARAEPAEAPAAAAEEEAPAEQAKADAPAEAQAEQEAAKPEEGSE